MPGTERLHNQIADCDAEMKRIRDDAYALQEAVAALVSDFGVKYPKTEMSGLTEAFADCLSDIVDDLEGPAFRRKMRLEDEIGRIEWADLERDAPIVI